MKNITENNWEKEFDEKFKCIQSDCDGNGSIPHLVSTPDGEEAWEADQCQFHAEYLFPLKSFISSLLASHNKRVRERGYEEGYQDALDSKYGIGMGRIIKATKSLTLTTLRKKVEGMNHYYLTVRGNEREMLLRDSILTLLDEVTTKS